MKLNVEEIKEEQLKILKDIHQFCEANQLNYFLSCGTLLGAVRHLGYIPWDDDIDIMMPRPDYDKFITLYGQTQYSYQVADISIDQSYPYPFAKAYNPQTSLVEYSTVKYDIGINVDIFPIDGLPENGKKRKTHLKKMILLKIIRNIKATKYNCNRTIIKTLFLIFLKIMLCVFPYKKIVIGIDKLSRKYNYADSKYVSSLYFGESIDRYFQKSIFEEFTCHEFEGSFFRIPLHYDLFLTAIYGDYMQLPPVEKRKTHHIYTAYRVNHD
jgi:lipopolysaccharide cholinephosphotransferase